MVGCTWTAVRPTARPVLLSSLSTVVTRASHSSKSGRRTFQSTSFSQILCSSRSRAGRFQHVPSPGNGMIHETDVNMARVSECLYLEICHMYISYFYIHRAPKNGLVIISLCLYYGKDELHEESSEVHRKRCSSSVWNKCLWLFNYYLLILS